MKTYLFAVVLLVVPSLATAEPKETEPTLKPNKSQALIRELPKFSDEPEGIGVGFGVGEPMGLAVAYRPNKAHTFAAMTGWSFSDSTLHLHADYLLTFATIKPRQSAISLGIYTGVGPTINLGRADEQAGFGARVPIGMSMAFEKPIDIFAEFAPVIGLIPDLKLYANGTLGVRAWFRPKR